MNMEIRHLENGVKVVDLGRKWFRVHPHGGVTTCEVQPPPPGEIVSSVKRRRATKREADFATKCLSEV